MFAVGVKVLCVDDGNRENLPLTRLRPLEEKFATLPWQAICCALSGVQPLPVDSSKKSMQPCSYRKSIKGAISATPTHTHTNSLHITGINRTRT